MNALAGQFAVEPALDGGSGPALLTRWSRTDTALVVALIGIAATTRFWHLGHPRATVFDETFFVGQGGAYLRGEQFIDPHPPLEQELIALSMRLFGTSNPWAWRLPNAIAGTGLVGITYALARRMFESRSAGVLAASFVLLDGVFLVDSRVAVPEIIYITLAALSYFVLFRFTQTPNPYDGRRTLLMLGITLGLCLGGKLLLPGIAFLLVMGFLIYALAARWPALDRPPQRARLIAGATLLVGATAALGYAAVFMPNFLLLRWRGVDGLIGYYRDVVWFEQSVAGMSDSRTSPWWSWPLMARPLVFWQQTADNGQLSTIWFGGNPVLWWCGLAAICITAARLVSRPNLAGAFVVIGYLGYLLIVVPISRVMYLYHYMPALFLGFLALANVASDCWRGRARRWEQALLLTAIIPATGFAIGGAFGAGAMAVMAIGGGAILWRSRGSGRLVCISLFAAALAAFVYFLPIWIGLPISRTGFEARMWLHGPGLYDWTYATR